MRISAMDLRVSTNRLRFPSVTVWFLCSTEYRYLEWKRNTVVDRPFFLQTRDTIFSIGASQINDAWWSFETEAKRIREMVSDCWFGRRVGHKVTITFYSISIRPAGRIWQGTELWLVTYLESRGEKEATCQEEWDKERERNEKEPKSQSKSFEWPRLWSRRRICKIGASQFFGHFTPSQWNCTAKWTLNRNALTAGWMWLFHWVLLLFRCGVPPADQGRRNCWLA